MDRDGPLHIFVFFFSTLIIKLTCTKHMLEVVPGNSNTGTVKRQRLATLGR